MSPPVPLLEATIEGLGGCPHPWSINVQNSQHWTRRANAVKCWRRAAELQGRSVIKAARNEFGLAANAHLPKCLVRPVLYLRTDQKRDPSNFMPAVKAVIDGLTDAGWWPDDDSTWVEMLEPTIIILRVEPIIEIKAYSHAKYGL